MSLTQKYFFLSSFIAFIFYSAVNFFYFPLAPLFGDEGRFIREAIHLYETGEFFRDSDRAWEMPLTAVTYSVFYSIFQTQEGLIASVRIFQSILLLLQAYFLYKISLKIFSNITIARITHIVTLFYPFFVFYQGLLLSETIFITMLIVAFYNIYSWYERGFLFDKYFLMANIFLVLSIYTKGTLSILPPLLLSSFYFVQNFDIKKSLQVFVASVFVYSLFMSVWWVRNYIIFDKFVPFTTSSGMNLYLGNNSQNLTGGCDWSQDVDIKKVDKLFAIEEELQRNTAFKQEALEFIKNNPNRFFELMYLKLKRFYNVFPNTESFNHGLYKWVSLISYGGVFVLFIVSIVIHYRQFRALSAIYILVLYFTLLHIVFIASLRYRLPIEPFMILLAAPVIYKLTKRLKVQ